MNGNLDEYFQYRLGPTIMIKAEHIWDHPDPRILPLCLGTEKRDVGNPHCVEALF